MRLTAILLALALSGCGHMSHGLGGIRCQANDQSDTTCVGKEAWAIWAQGGTVSVSQDGTLTVTDAELVQVVNGGKGSAAVIQTEGTGTAQVLGQALNVIQALSVPVAP